MEDTRCGEAGLEVMRGRKQEVGVVALSGRQIAFSTHNQCNALMEVIRNGREYLPAFGRPVSYEAGVLLYDYGDRVDRLYLVNEGRVRTSVLSAEGRELVTGLYGSGELFGQFCLCDHHERNERAIVVEEAVIVHLGVAELLQLASSGDGALALLQLFCHRISALEEQVAQLAFAKVRTRLALLLLRLAEEGEAQPDGSVLCRDNPTHEEMASRIGTTREQVTTLLAQFRKDGLISYQRTGPLRIDPVRLRDHVEAV